MDELDKIYSKLEAIENLYGLTGVAIAILLLIIGVLIWLFLKNYMTYSAKSIFNKSLAEFQSNLLKEVGNKFILQKGEIEKEMIGIKAEIDKEINKLNSNLNVLSGQESNFLNERRKALIDTYQAIFVWINKIMEQTPYQLSQKPEGYITEIDKEFKIVKNNFLINYASFNVYNNDRDLTNLMSNLMLKTSDLQETRRKQLFKCNLLNKKFKGIEGKMEDLSLKENSEEDLKIKEELRGIHEETISVIEKFDATLEEKLKPILGEQFDLAKKISEIIKNSFEKK